MLARIHFFKLLYFILGYSQLKGTTEEEIVEWYHQFNGRKFEQTWGVCEGQGSLASCDPWGQKVLDTNE